MLTTNHPTPTTVLYTLSTSTPSRTLSSHLLAALSLCLRLAASSLALALLLHDYTSSIALSSALNFHIVRAAGELVLSTHPAKTVLVPLLDATPRLYRLSTALLLAYVVLKRFHTTESLLVIRGLGVQTSTSSPSYVGTARTRFIPTSSIQDIFIHEAFKGFEVRFYLSIVVEGEEGVVVVFPVSGLSLWEL